MDAILTLPQMLPFAMAAILLVLLLEQIAYIRKKGPLPGRTLVLPFLGSAARMARGPARYWGDLAALAKCSSHGASADYLFGRFVVFVRDNSLSHKVFANVRPDAFHVVVHPFGKKLFSERNVLNLFLDKHRDLHGRMARLLGPRALATYSALQQQVIGKHMRMWLAAAERSPSSPLKLLTPIREMSLEIIHTDFAGPYISSEMRRRFREEINLFSEYLYSLPLDLPGLPYRRARHAIRRGTRSFTAAARDSRARMSSGEAPSCLMDFWTSEVVAELAAGEDPARAESSDEYIAEQVFELLFASSSSLASSFCWSVALLSAHPDVADHIRREVSATSGAPFTQEALQRLRYTAAVAKEVLRMRPPALALPHVNSEPFQLTEGYTIPKGTLVFPSIYESSLCGFPDAGRFDPARFMEPRNEDKVFKKNFLAFGAGSHQCVAQHYSLNIIVLFIAMFVQAFDSERHLTEGCDEFVCVPGIAPKDECAVFLRPRRRPEAPAHASL